MYFTSGSDRAFEQLMQTRPGADHFDNGEAGAPEDCGTCRFYRPHWKYQFCVYEECPYQPGKLTALDGAVKFQVKGVDDEMAVFRVEKNRGYTVMSNHHLRNKDLSLKAKGLLSQMLSLPESWDFTLKGLSLINREQIDAIRAAVRELEQAGYIVRSRERDSQGRLRGADYIIYEQPQPVPDSPTLENPTLDNPTQEKPTQEKPTQLNKDRSSKEKSITDGSNTDSILILSPPSPLGEEAAAPPERKGTGAKSQSAVEIYREIIKDNIEYALNGIQFEVDKGEFVGIMGASGSGKTTLLNCISTIDTATNGHIYLDGKDILEIKEKDIARFRRESLGFIFQDFNLLDTLTIEENIALAWQYYGKDVI